jgi:hypothetical protein
MSPLPPDPWRLPTIAWLGAQLRELERDTSPVAGLRSPISRGVMLVYGAVIGAALIAVVVVFAFNHSAQARSVLSEAPAAAEGSGTVRFQSVLTVQTAGHRGPRITEQGAIDFRSGAYASTVRLAGAGRVLERRSVAGVLYAADRSARGAARAAQVRWVARPLREGARRAFASEGDAFTDPFSVFDALSGIRGPVRRAGHQTLNGVPTTRYELLTNLEAFLRSSQGHIENPLAYRGVRASLEGFLDAQGRPLLVQESFAGPSAMGQVTVTTAVRFFAYGRSVSVSPPGDFRTVHGTSSSPKPLDQGLGSLLARRLFFQPPPR